MLDTSEAGGLVIRGGIVRTAGYVASTLIALLGVVLLTRHLGVVDFGRFQTVVSLILIVGSLTDVGMSALGVREFAQRSGPDRDRLMRALLGLRMALTVLGIVISISIAAAIGYDRELLLGVALAGVGLGLLVLLTTLTIPLMVGMRNVTLTAVDVLRQLLTVGAYGLLVLAGAGVVAFLAVPVPVGVILVVVVALLVRGQMPLRPSLQPAEWARLLRAAAAFAAATTVGTIYLYAAQILTAAVTNGEETGLFSAAFRVFVIAGAVPGLIVSVAFPLLSRAARDDRDRLAYAVQRLLDAASVVGLAAALGVVLGAPVIIDVMAGASFAGAVGPLRILGVTMTATFVLAPLGFALLSMHLHRALLIANSTALLVTLAGVTSLAAAFGPEGAALGTVIGESTLAISYWIALRRSAPSVAPGFSSALRALVVALPCAALALAPLPAVVATVLGLGAYALLVLLVRAVPEEVLELLPFRAAPRDSPNHKD